MNNFRKAAKSHCSATLTREPWKSHCSASNNIIPPTKTDLIKKGGKNKISFYKVQNCSIANPRTLKKVQNVSFIK